MREYPKKVLSIQEQIQSFLDAGLIISSQQETKNILLSIGFYRLRGYSFQWYDKNLKKYKTNTKLSDILALYNFDMEMSHILSGFLSKIEIALRVRFAEALLQATGDSLVLLDPSQFNNKEYFWQNLSAVSSEIQRSKDIFIKHNYDNHSGIIPIWAAVEVISFGTLSKLISNLANKQAASILQQNYQYPKTKTNIINPPNRVFYSWVRACAVLRNICAHNSRIYNRIIDIKPSILDVDKNNNKEPEKVYRIILSMKYLRPDNESWKNFVLELKTLFHKYSGKFDFQKIGFPNDWEEHLLPDTIY